MTINIDDIVVLHKNVNRAVGKEIHCNNSLANNDSEIMQSISKLLSEEILVTKKELETSLRKLNISDLKIILKNNNFKITASKPTLIKRIIDNIEIIDFGNIELPTVYIITDKGQRILDETDYITDFLFSSLGYRRAHYIAQNYIDSSSNFKTEEIYEFEINRILANGDFDYNTHIVFSDYILYLIDQKQYSKARTYINLSSCINIKELISDIQNSKISYYDYDGELDLKNLENGLMPIAISYDEIYERLIYNDKLSNQNIYNLFIKDVQFYFQIEDKELYRCFIDYLISIIKKENQKETFNKIIEVINEKYRINKQEFEFEDYEYEEEYEEDEDQMDYSFKTSIKNLIDKNIDVEVTIDTETGDLFFSLDQDTVEDIISEQNDK